jgi:hypothetical protein
VRLPRGVYPERKFFDKLRMSGLRAQDDTRRRARNDDRAFHPLPPREREIEK